jgi:prolyl-tRNA editing enzyme YbaK/EbsC (Cys-tRNA(Pro) deacylase)
MSKSLRRVQASASTLGLHIEIRELTVSTRTAAEAAQAVNCHPDQIVKSILLRGCNSDQAILFLTAGGNRVCPSRAALLAGEPLGKADAGLIRRQTGFAIGGVSPLGHLTPVRCFADPRLLEFDLVWAAAGTPRHMFCIAPGTLLAAIAAQTGDFIEDKPAG